MKNGKQKLERSEAARNETGIQDADLEVLHVTETGHRLSSELSRRTIPTPCGLGSIRH